MFSLQQEFNFQILFRLISGLKGIKKFGINPESRNSAAFV
jgi:hypothetical protein